MNFLSSRKGNHDDTESESEREESHSSSEDEDLSSYSSGGDVQADFAFFDAKPDDFHGVKVLMTTYPDNKEWALSIDKSNKFSSLGDESTPLRCNKNIWRIVELRRWRKIIK
ncbi:protein BCCIP homolog isoform X2 [Tanacetum coccineum]|uniref:Protein BCCIP homolog isoform X2 n=1 Tax=Tanacetum coccineum TaxID=301880 RepID=A0ABQ5BFL6_9ASTR